MKNSLLILFLILSLTNSVKSQTDTTNKEYKIFHYQNGNISSEGYMINNVPSGYWKSYYITGVKKSEGKWNNNQLDSIWIFYDQLGDTTEKISYYLGKRNGYQQKYYTTKNQKNKVYKKELYLNGKKSGTTYIYYPDGKIKKEIPYEDDKMQGLGFEYDEKGNIIVFTRYRNNEILINEEINRFNNLGNKEGVWKEFYDNGNLKEEKNYLDGKLNGLFKIYDREGKLVELLNYKNGEVDLTENDIDIGVEIKEEYDEKGNIIFQGSYKNNKKIGVHRWFDKEGDVVKSEIYDIYGNLNSEGIVLLNGNENGEWKYYYKNGKLKAKGKYNKGNRIGKWTFYYSNSVVQQTGSYVNNKYTGNWTWYYDNGSILKEEFYLYGKLDGEAIEYDMEGNIISKGNYIEGLKEGKWIYTVGDQKFEGNYVMDEKDGIWKSYYLISNELCFEGKYIQGLENGKHVYYYPNGNEKEERYYSEGIKVKSWTKYDENGKMILVVQYKDGVEYKINGQKVNLQVY